MEIVSMSLIVGYIAACLIFLIVGILMIDSSRSGYGKFILIWLVSIILIGIVFLWIAFSPNAMSKVIGFFSRLSA